MAEQAEEGSGLFVGAPVLVRGLQGSPEYNGKMGSVSGGPFDNGRYEITIPLDDKQESKVLALKPANIQLDVEALQKYVMNKRIERSKRDPPLEDNALVWLKGKGLSVKGLRTKKSHVPELEPDCVLLRIDKFSFSHMALGYLMKGFTRTFSGYHNFFPHPDEGHYRSACYGYATVIESAFAKVPVGTRLYGLVPPCKYHMQKIGRTIPAGKHSWEPPLVEFASQDVPFSMRRFLEHEVVSTDAEADDPDFDEWKIVLKELYTMAYYMDENLLVSTGMINSVIISCASSKTAMALAFCLRMRVWCGHSAEMRYVVGLTSPEHKEFVKSTDFYHEVMTYDEVDSLPNDRTIVYIDFKCDGAVRQAITLRMGTNLMYNMVAGPAVFQKGMKDQVFEKRAREELFDESKWRERRQMVAEVTKTGRNEKLRESFKPFIDRLKQHVRLKHVGSAEALLTMYEKIYDNKASPDEAYVCSLHEEEFAVEEIWGA